MKTTPLKSSTTSAVPQDSQSLPTMQPSYIDPLSPIASAPKNSIKLPSTASLQSPSGIQLEDGSWTSKLIFPMLKIFSNEENCANDDATTDTNSEEVKVSDDDGADTTSNLENENQDMITASEPDCEEDLMEEDEEAIYYEFDPILFMSQLPEHHLVKHNVQDPRPLPFPADARKPTLILDLDETLVHCSADAFSTYHVTFGVEFNGSLCQVYVRKRPHLETFLETVSRKFEVVIFTASQRVYAERLLDILDPQRKYISHRLYRESCLMVAGNLLKDLSILDRDLRKTIIVDNSPHAFGYQIDNGIPIESWYEDPHDVELLRLLPILEYLHQADDVRPEIRKLFQLRDAVDKVRFRY